jgi:hypothetical protein
MGCILNIGGIASGIRATTCNFNIVLVTSLGGAIFTTHLDASSAFYQGIVMEFLVAASVVGIRILLFDQKEK